MASLQYNLHILKMADKLKENIKICKVASLGCQTIYVQINAKHFPTHSSVCWHKIVQLELNM